MAFDFRLTDAGAAALQAAVAGNTSITVAKVALGTGRYTPDGTETALRTPFTPVKEFIPTGGSATGAVLKFDFQDGSTAAYDVGEVGVFDGTGTLLFLASRPAAGGWLYSKSTGATSGFSFEYALAVAEMPTVTFAGAGRAVGLADRDTHGLARRAAPDTPDSDDERFVTPAILAARQPEVPEAQPERSRLVDVAAAQVTRTNNEIRLAPTPAFTGLAEGDTFRWRQEFTSNGGVTVKVNALAAVPLRRRGGAQVGTGGVHLASGDVVQATYDGSTLYLAGLLPGTAAQLDAGTAAGQVPVLGTGGRLAAARLPSSGLAADTLDGYHQVVLTQAQYNALAVKDPNTFYDVT